jgi:DNA-binding FadR family transcriptional regulator
MSTVSSKYTQLSDLVDEHQQLLDVIQTGTKSAVLKVIDEHLKSAVTALTKDGARATSGN